MEADVLRLNKEKKKVTTNMMLIQFRKDLPGVKMPSGVLAPKVMTKIVNIDSDHQQYIGLISILFGQGI